MCSGSASIWSWFATKNVVLPKRILYAYMRVGKGENVYYVRTVRLLRDFALLGKREEYLLRGWLGDCALEVGGDVDSAIRTVYLTNASGTNLGKKLANIMTLLM